MRFALSTILLLTGLHLSAQSYTENATVITFQNDTIKGLMPHQLYFEKKVPIKSMDTYQVQKIKVSEVKSVTTKYARFDNLQYQDGKKWKSTLAKLVIDGPLKLYMMVDYINKKPAYVSSTYHPGTSRIKVNAHTYSSGYQLDYLLVKDDLALPVNKENFLKVIRLMTDDCPKYQKLLDDKLYKYENREKAINRYNKEIIALAN